MNWLTVHPLESSVDFWPGCIEQLQRQKSWPVEGGEAAALA
jgi:hypothetical protein